jgi:hypothetical protein
LKCLRQAMQFQVVEFLEGLFSHQASASFP